MQQLKTLLGIFLSASLMACGSGIGGQMCQRSFDCAAELEGQPQGTVAECVDDYNSFTEDYTADQMALIEAAFNICLAKTSCQEFADCLDSMGN